MNIIPNALALIKEYVSDGGGLLMIGGYLSFTGIEAKANYKNTLLADVLPVEMLDHDDRVEIPEGCCPVNTDTQHIITQKLQQWPPLLGYNKFRAKIGSNTLVKINNDPLLVLVITTMEKWVVLPVTAHLIGEVHSSCSGKITRPFGITFYYQSKNKLSVCR